MKRFTEGYPAAPAGTRHLLVGGTGDCSRIECPVCRTYRETNERTGITYGPGCRHIRIAKEHIEIVEVRGDHK